MPQEHLIQIMRPGALGDLLMATCVLEPLKAQGHRIRFIAHPDYISILENHPHIDELVPARSGSCETLLKETAELPSADRTIYLYYPFYGKMPLPTHPMPMHVTASFCEQAGVSVNQNLSVCLDDDQENWGMQYRDTILIHTKTRWSPYKDWFDDRWEALVSRLRSETGLPVYQLGQSSERQVPGTSFIEGPTIRHAIAALKHCRVFIGLDSVFNHASKAVGKPSVILWGSTHPQNAGYLQNINLVNGVAWHPETGLYGSTFQCQPCYREYPGPKKDKDKHPCPYTVPYPVRVLPERMHPDQEVHACMHSQTVDLVLTHALSLLRGSQQGVSKPDQDLVAAEP